MYAIPSPSSTSGSFVSLNTIAIPIITQVQMKDTAREILILLRSGISLRDIMRISRTVEEDIEFIEELSVDMAAAKIPASMSPLKPAGTLLTINEGITA